MTPPEFLLLEGAQRLKIGLDERVAGLLSRYCDELLRWNRRINLVARRTGREEALEKHFLDSLALLPLLNGYGVDDSLLDVGTGAGFPGLVIAAARPELRVTLVEPRRKRVAFLRHIVRTLDLKNVRLIACRIEQASTLADQRFGWVTGRAVAEPAAFLAMLTPVLKRQVKVILMLSRSGRASWQERPVPGFRVQMTREYLLPYSGSFRCLIVLG